MTWHLRRLIGIGPLCALLTLALPMLLAALVNAQRTEDEVLGVMLVASLIVFIGSLAGSAITACLGTALFGAGALLAQPPVIVLMVVGAGLYVAVTIHDLAGVLHRAPRVGRAVWTTTAATTTGVVAIAATLFAVTYGLGKLATWESIVVPFGVIAIGFAAKTAADAHRSTEQTARRNTPRSDAAN